MNLSRIVVLTVLAMLVAAPVARAQEKAPRIAVINIGRVFSEMRERKDLQEKMKNDLAAIQSQDTQKQATLRQLKERRDAMEATAPDYQKINEEFTKAAIEYEVWKRTMDAEMGRSFKTQIKGLADKIEVAAGELCKQKGIEILLVDQRPDLPPTLEEIPVERLKAALNQRTLLYVDPKMDISPDVIASLDAKYKAGDKPK